MTSEDPQRPLPITPEVARSVHDAVLRGGEPDYSTRFQKGQSGNPNGRPSNQRKSADASRHDCQIAAQASEIARRLIPVRDGDGPREVDAVEASLLQLRRKAVAGDVPAIRLMFDLAGQHEAAERIRLVAEDEKWVRISAKWAAHVAQKKPLFEAAVANGLPPPAIYPHPDDLVFEANNWVELIGPIDAESDELYQRIVSMADYWIAYMAYDVWRGHHGRPFCARTDYVYVTDILFCQDQQWLPPRMRLKHDEVVSKFMHYRALNGRALHRKLSELGRAVEMPVPPWRSKQPFTVPLAAWEIARRNGVGILEVLQMWIGLLQKDKDTLRAELAEIEAKQRGDGRTFQ